LNGSARRDAVAEILWDGSGGRNSDLDQVALSARRALGPASDALRSIAYVRLDKALLTENVVLTSDVEAFYSPAAKKDARLACQAVRLYRGSLLDGLRLDQSGETWLDAERIRQERQLRNHLALIFPDADADDLDEYVAACRRGESQSVADLAPTDLQEERSSAPSDGRRDACNAPIGVIAPMSAWPTAFYTNIIKGIRNGADSDEPDHRRNILVFDVARDYIDEVDAVLATALEQDIPGLIAINATWSNKVRDIMRQEGRRVVSVMVEDLAPPVCCSIVLDNAAFTELIDHILAGGCAAAVLVTPPPFDRSNRNMIDFARNDKRRAYETLTVRAGLKPGVVRALDADLARQPFDAGFAYVVEIPSYEAAIGEYLFTTIADSLSEHTALVFLNDCQAASFLAACQRSGRSAIDRRLRVSAYEDTDAAKWFGISTVDPQLDLIGRLAYENLQAALDDPTIGYLPETVSGVLRLRRSTEWDS
jgi:DNA-binding LacI/PurR family transcriptional regulator